MSPHSQRAFTTGFKESVVARLAAGERLASVSRELGIPRKLLYDWRKAYRLFGSAGLNRKRGPKPGRKRSMEKPPALAAPSAPDAASAGGELALAHARIAELERLIGRQQVDLDFFHKALRLTDAARLPARIAPTSTRSSKP